MAQVNIGAIKFNWKGPYNNGTTYAVDDVVSSGGSSYVCILASTGNAVSNGTYWQIMSSAGTDADLINIGSTAQGDLYYNSGGAIARLAAGTSGQFLKTQGASANPVWAAADSGKTLGIKQFTNNTRTAGIGTSSSRQVLWTPGTFTKIKSNSWLHIRVALPGGGAASSHPHFGDTFIRFSTTTYDNDGSDIFGYLHNTRADAVQMGANIFGDFIYDTASTNISGTGTIYVRIGWHSAAGVLHPFAVWNPNASDEARSRQTVSNCVITELDF